MVSAYASLQSVGKLFRLSDEMTQTNARLQMVKESFGESVDLQEMIYQSAQRSRAAYQTTADAVAKLGLNAKDAFNSTEEIVMFAETLNKQFVIAGTEAATMEGAMTQLVQALGSGTLRGDELNSIFEAAPGIIQTIADYMGVPIGKIREMASEGQITADIVKNAMLSASGEIDEKFQNMPMTWANVWTGIMNAVYRASMPLLEFINILANNWSIIQPIALGMASAIGVYLVATKGATLATKAWKAAQAAFNAVMNTNPVGLVVMGVILLISVISAVINAINKAKGTTLNGVGVIIGAIYALVAYVRNNLADFINFFVDVWKDPVGSVARLFGGLADNVLGMLELIAKGIDLVFGSNLVGTISGWRSGLSGMIEDKFGKGSEIAQKVDISEAFGKGHEMGAGLSDYISSFFGGGSAGDYAGGYEESQVPAYVADTAENTGKIADAMEITSEDLKYLRDIAETEAINRFTTAEIKIDMTNNNSISSNMDLDGVVGYLVTGVNDAMEKAVEGVHD
jgi:tape measure domain-containing protein